MEHCGARVHVGVSGEPSQTHNSSHSVAYSRFGSQEGTDFYGNSGLSKEECRGGSPQHTLSGILQSHLPGAQTGLDGHENDHQPEAPQQVVGHSHVSYVNSSGGQVHVPSRTLCNFHRFERCLPPYPCCSVSQEVPSFYLGGSGVPVSGPAIRAKYGTTPFYEDISTFSPMGSSSGDRTSAVPRRLADTAQGSSGVITPHSLRSGPGAEVGFPGEPQKIGLTSKQDIQVSRHGLRSGYSDCFYTSGPKSQGFGCSECFHQQDQQTGQGLGGPSRSPDQYSGPCGQRQVEFATAANRVQCSMGQMFQESVPSHFRQRQAVSSLVDPRDSDINRGVIDSVQTKVDNLHRCFHCGLGGYTRSGGGSGYVESPGVFTPYQPFGTVGGNQGYRSVEGNSAAFSGISRHGQHDSGGLYQEARGHPLTVSLGSDTRFVSPLRETGYSGVRQAHSGAFQCSGGQALSQGAVNSHGVGVEQPSVQVALSALDLPLDRSICDAEEQQGSAVCLPGTRCSGNRGGRLVSGLGGDVCLRVPPISVTSSSSAEVVQGLGGVNPDSSAVEEPGLVPTFTSVGSGTSCEATSSQGSVSSVGSQSSKSKNAKSSRLETVQLRLRRQGFSEGVAQVVTHRVRPSTASVYGSRWQAFVDWCLTMNIEPTSPSIPQIADFLLHLSNDKNFAPGTIEGYKTSISSVLSTGLETSVGKDPVLSALMQGLYRANPRSSNLVPKWDLGIVLHALTGKPFEPIQFSSLKALTLKTVFLLALATGARRSELHALSYKVFWGPDLTQVVLQPVLGFLRKNQRISESQDVITVPALRPLLQRDMREDISLCPVRSLYNYTLRTKEFRGARERLFLSYKPGFKGEISSQTVSTWIKLCIQEAYRIAQTERQDIVPMVKAKAHEVRALAASWAKFNGLATSKIMEAATWRTTSVFANHYLRDCTLMSEDIFKLSATVVSGSVVRTKRKKKH